MKLQMKLQMKLPVNFLLKVRIDFLSYRNLFFLHSVLVNGFQHIISRVAHPLLRVSVWDTQRQHDACVNMAQVVESIMLYACVFANDLKPCIQ